MLGVLEPEADQRILGNGGAAADRGHDLAVVLQRQPLDEMRRDLLSGV